MQHLVLEWGLQVIIYRIYLEGTELGKLRDELREQDPTAFAMGELIDPALLVGLTKKIMQNISAKRLGSANKLLGDLNLGEKILGPSDGVTKFLKLKSRNNYC